jgi:uncharacterized membrane protein YhaH (DUF805 family)
MQMMDAVRRVLSNYATFSGRAARPEYWWWVLAVVLGSVVFRLIDSAIFGGAEVDGAPVQVFSALFGIAILLPMLAVGARRLHDTDRSAWWLLLNLLPLIGALVLLWFYVQRGTEGPNRFGPPALPL